jgi:hypothetical protein
VGIDDIGSRWRPRQPRVHVQQALADRPRLIARRPVWIRLRDPFLHPVKRQ